jgi:hypothetical protein
VHSSFISCGTELCHLSIDAAGTARLWQWGAQAGGWVWRYLNYFELCVPPTLATSAAAAAAEAVAEPHLHSVALVRERSSEQQATYRAVWVQSQYSAVHAATTAAVWSRRLTLELHPVPGTADAATAAGDSAEQRSSVEVGFAVVLSELLAPPSALLGCLSGVWAVGVNGCSSAALNVNFETGRMQSVSLCTATAADSSNAGSQAASESVDTAATAATTSGATAGVDKDVHGRASEKLNGHLNGAVAVAAQTGSAEQTSALFAIHKVRCNVFADYLVSLIRSYSCASYMLQRLYCTELLHIVASYSSSL